MYFSTFCIFFSYFLSCIDDENIWNVMIYSLDIKSSCTGLYVNLGPERGDVPGGKDKYSNRKHNKHLFYYLSIISLCSEQRDISNSLYNNNSYTNYCWI